MIVSVKFTNSEQAMQRFEVSEPGTRFNFFFLVWASLAVHTAHKKCGRGIGSRAPKGTLFFSFTAQGQSLEGCRISIVYVELCIHSRCFKFIVKKANNDAENG